MAVTWTFVDTFTEEFAKGAHDLDGHAFKLALSNTAPSAANTVLADITQISAAGGYTAGGYALTGVAVTRSTSTTKFDADDVTVAASGANIGPFQYEIIYNDTSSGDKLIGWFTLDAAETVLDGDSPTLKFSSNGIFIIRTAAS
jgi:hypothetical protein